MSHFTTIEVTLDSLEALKKALEQMGHECITGHHVMENNYGESSEVDLEIKDLPVGFIEQDNGTIEMEADWWGTGINEDEFTQELTQLHSKYKTLDSLRKEGWRLQGKEETREDGSIKLTVRRWSS